MRQLQKTDKKNIRDIIGLTFAQEGMLAHYLRNPQSQLNFEQLIIGITGDIDLLRFEKAWNLVVKTNEMLRTIFLWEKIEKPIQVVLKEHKLQPGFHDLSGMTDEERQEHLYNIKSGDREQKFDLREVPFRVILCKTGPGLYEMIVSNHHIILDGWSSGIILKEFLAAYETLTRGKNYTPPVKPSFKEFVRWLKGREKEERSNFWKEYLKNYTPPIYTYTYKTDKTDKSGLSPFPLRRKRTGTDISAAHYKSGLSPLLIEKLEQFSKNHKVTLSSMLYAAWGLLLQAYNNAGDVVYDVTVSGRTPQVKGIENMVGLFINTLPLRVETKSTETVGEFLSRLNGSLQQREPFENTPISDLEENLGELRGGSLFDSVVVVENYPLDRELTNSNSNGDQSIGILSFDIEERTQYDLTVLFSVYDGIEAAFTYNTELFDEQHIGGLLELFERLLMQMVDSHGELISVPELGSDLESERQALIAFLNKADESGENDSKTAYTAPRGKVETALTGLWASVLDIRDRLIGIDDDFFDFGGHSLKASILSARVQKEFNMKMPLAEIFKNPTPRELAVFIRANLEENNTGDVRGRFIIPAERKDYYGLSSAQHRFYMLQQMEPDSTFYNGPMVMKLEGELDLNGFNEAFRQLVARHESLRTVFRQIDGHPVQEILDDVPFEIQQIRETGDIEQAVRGFIRPFQLSQPPLFRVGLMETQRGEHILVMDFHHIITDGASRDILVKDFAALYSGASLPALALHNKDFSQWQHRRLNDGDLKDAENFWLERFNNDYPVLNMPLDFPRPSSRRYDGDCVHFSLSNDLTQEIRQLMEESGTTLFMVLLSAFNILLSRYGSQDDIVIGTTVAGRGHVGLEEIVGLLLETLALRTHIDGEMDFARFLEHIKDQTLETYDNQDYPYRELVKKLGIRNEDGRNPLFDVMLIVQNFDRRPLELEGLTVTPVSFDPGISKVDISLEAEEDREEIRLELEYCTALFERETMERFADHFVNILREAVENPTGKLRDMQVFSPGERRLILEDFNKPLETSGDNRLLHQLFEAQAARTPSRPAVTATGPGSRQSDLTYGELNREADALAYRLRQEGVHPGDMVGIKIEPGIEMFIGLMGILKSGAAYLPIDPQYPEERIQYMQSDSGTQLILTRDDIIGFETTAPDFDSTIHNLFQPATHLCYIIYTSGSTGRPKGVMVEHRNVVNYIHAFQEEFALTENDIVLQQASFSFDVFVEEVYPILSVGGRLAVPGDGEVKDIGLLTEFISRFSVTVVDCSPLMLNQLNQQDPALLESVHTFISGGDLLKGEYIDNLLKTGRVYNTYGPTESTVCATYHRCSPGDGGPSGVSIGTPITGYNVYILDKHFNLQPIGVPGELCVAGEGVARGYLNRPNLTAERFPDNSTFNIQNSKLYRTGDLARWKRDGSIEFMGRIDHQVKIRGYRIETGEIEECLLSHRGILQAVVTTAEGRAERKHLCAYIVPGDSPDLSVTVSSLKDHLSKRLPAYMLPSFFVPLEEMPLTPNGKIDKKALPHPAGNTLHTGADYTPPRNETEKKLVEIWEQVLAWEEDNNPIGTGDNFFDLGGDSISAGQCVARIRQEFQADVSLKSFFENPYISSLAKEVGRSGYAGEQTIDKTSRDGDIPLSFAQEQLWFLNRLDRNNKAYIVPRALRVKGSLDISLFGKTYTEIIRRHEILRTVFTSVNGQPVQRVRPPFEMKINVADLTHLEDREREREAAGLITREAMTPFDFEKGPMIRVKLIKLKEDEHILISTEHHLIHDGWTQGVLLREFITIYSAFYRGEPSPLPELEYQYGDFAHWQRSVLRGEVMENHLSFWKTKLEGLPPVTDLPLDRPRPAAISGNGDMERLVLDEDEARTLKRFSRENGVTLFMTMLAAFKTMLLRYGGSGDICIGSGIANRKHKALENMLGMIINTVPLRTVISHDISFSQCLDMVKTTCLESYEHQDTPLEKIVAAVKPERSLSYTPLFQVLFSFMDTPHGHLNLPGLRLEVEPSHNRAAKFDMNLVIILPVEREEGEILIDWEYNTDLFDGETIRRMMHHYRNLLESACEQPGTNLLSLRMLESPEKRRLLEEFNRTDAPFPMEKTLHGIFREQAARTPEHTAVIAPVLGEDETIELTYGELDEKSDGLAILLREKGVDVDVPVALMAQRSVEMMVAILAILKAGGAYLPIDPNYPEDRINYMLGDSHAPLVLTHRRFLDRLDGTIPVLNLDDRENYGSGGTVPGEDVNQPTDLAYIIYTSGSTGRPKGVMIQHGSAVNRMNWVQRVYPHGPSDTILQKTPFVFDVSAWELFTWFFGGSTLCFLEVEGEKDPASIIRAVETHGVTIMHFVPSMLHAFLSHLEDGAPDYPDLPRLASLRHVNASGEALKPHHVQRFNGMLHRHNQTRLVNLYGPTEATVDVSYFDCSPTESGNPQSIPIGKPIDNTQLYIVDKSMGLQPVGAAGELCIAGVGLARGYLNRPELTAEKFPSNSKFKIHNSKLYKSGDLCRWLPDGNIEFMGRIDHQVKIRGYRIELGEIEKELSNHPQIDEAVVTVYRRNGEDLGLSAYIVAKTGESPERRELVDHLARKLPEYMIPTYFVSLDRIPVTVNGKVDRRALPEPEGEVKSNDVAPRNEEEKKMAALWAGVLGLEEDAVGIDSNFFRLGGHSLKAAVLISKIHQSFNVEIPLARLFRTPTIRGLVEEYLREGQENTYETIQPSESRDSYPLSSSQRRLYVVQQMDENNTAYNVPAAILLEGTVDRERLENVFLRLIQRYESLRTSFQLKGEEPVQVVHPEVPFSIKYIDAAGTSPDGHIGEFIRPFDLSCAPLMRVGLLKTGPGTHVLLVDMHHIVTDGTSLGVLVKELMALYNNRSLPAPRLQFRDYCMWLETPAQVEQSKKHEGFWLSQFKTPPPPLNLPVDFPRPAAQAFEGNRIRFNIDHKNTQLLGRLAADEGATLFMVLLSFYNVLLMKLSGESDIVVGCPLAGRDHAELQDMIGMFVNTLPLRNHVDSQVSFREFLGHVRDNMLEAFDHRRFPLEDLVEKVVTNRDLSRNPLFSAAFTLNNMELPQLELPGLTLKPYPHDPGVSKFDITLDVTETPEGLNCQFIYCSRLFKEETVERFARYLKQAVDTIMENPGTNLSDVEIIPGEEKQRILHEFSGNAIPFAEDKTIHELFCLQAAETPNGIAVVGDAQLTCAELDRQSDILATRLQEMGAGPGTIVAIQIERSIEMITGLLGILKTGAAYLPIDPAYPEERIQYMLSDSNAQITLTRDDIIDFKSTTLESIPVAHNFFKPATRNSQPATSFCYVIYTSGSTGRPKGVMVRHRGVVNLVEQHRRIFGQGPGTHMSQAASPSFDAMALEVWPCLLSGSTLYIADDETRAEPGKMRQWLLRNRIEVTFQSTLMAEQLLEQEWPPEDVPLRALSTGGDRLTKFPSLACPFKLYNLYGPTEDTVFTTWTQVLPASGENNTSFPHIGKPLTNHNVYILDSHHRLQPIGVPGELCIAGAGLAAGYLNQPGLTAQKFPNHSRINSKFIIQNSKLYKTGDLARWLPDGNIEFLGRTDHQVQIRGFRIETGEIENRLLELEEIRNVVVMDKQFNGDKHLCAYYIPETGSEIDPEVLREFLSRSLPGYMIPYFFVSLDTFPVTPGGKIDRKSLPEPRDTVSRRNTPARDELERKLVETWSDILGSDDMGIDDNFFQLGGHSLKATRMSAQVLKELGIKIPLTEIFKSPTIRQLARFIRGAEIQENSAVPQVEKKEYYPLSYSQEWYFVLQQTDKNSIAYNVPMALEIEGRLDTRRLEEAVKTVIKRHESLRTSFSNVSGEPVQRVHDDAPFTIQYRSAAENTDPALLLRQFVRPFDLTRAPLMRMQLVETDRQRHLLLVDIHHIISDGVSMNILVNDIMDSYNETGESLPEPRIHYKDFASWQRRLMREDGMMQHREYWEQQFAEPVPLLELPTDFPRSSQKNFEGGEEGFRFGKTRTRQLKELASQTGATLYMVVLAAVKLLLFRLSGQEDIIVEAPSAGRKHGDLQDIIGLLSNTLVMRSHPRAGKPFMQFLREVKKTTLDAYDHQEYPYEELVKKIKRPADAGNNGLYDFMFVFQDFSETAPESPGLKITPCRMDRQMASMDLVLTVVESEGELKCSFNYRSALFRRETVQQFNRCFDRLLSGLLENPHQNLEQFPMVTLEEEKMLLERFNQTGQPFPQDKTLHQLVEEQAARTPHSIALIGDGIGGADQQVTYHRLNRNADLVAAGLRERGVRPGSIVGLMVERSIEMITGLLGILKSGAAYMPIDPSSPAERIQYMQSDSNARIILTRDDIISYETTTPEPDHVAHNLFQPATSLCYVIYTSGSTGRPKGVMVEHRSVVNVVTSFVRTYNVTHRDRVLQQASIAFDVSVNEIFPVLSRGGTLVLTNPRSQLDFNYLMKIMTQHEITIFAAAPSLLARLNSLPYQLPFLRIILSGGEALNYSHVDRLVQSTTVVNGYGPTETTICSSCYHLPADPAQIGDIIPIGKPLMNYKLYVLDRNGVLLPPGMKGELCIGGPGVARGYLNRPDLTATHFPNSKFKIHNSKLYKTGDFVRWRADGNLEFHGRIDQQVKIRGFRIEPGEIENHLLEHEAVSEAAVIVSESQIGGKFLCAYLVAREHVQIDDLKNYLKEKLPPYMVPSHFMLLDHMPVNSSGKIDRKALPAPQIHDTGNYIPPTGEVEKKLVETWSTVLGLPESSVGVQTSFFDLGGHSLLAAVMVGKVFVSLGVNVPLADVFAAPYIRDMAKYIQNGAPAASAQKDSHLLLLRRNSESNRHLFFFHPGSGTVDVYLDFVRRLGSDFNYWGIQARRPGDIAPRPVTIPGMASKYLEVIKKVQPIGPYYLAGWSMGGAIALEVVRRLEAMNETVAFFSMIDSYIPDKKFMGVTGDFSLESERKWLNKLFSGNGLHKRLSSINRMDQLWPVLIDYLKDSPRAMDIVKLQIPPAMAQMIPTIGKQDITGLIGTVNLVRSHHYGWMQYVPETGINTPVFFFKAQQEKKPPERCWEKYCSQPFVTREVAGDHFSMFHDSNVAEFAKVFDRVLHNVEMR